VVGRVSGLKWPTSVTTDPLKKRSGPISIRPLRLLVRSRFCSGEISIFLVRYYFVLGLIWRKKLDPIPARAAKKTPRRFMATVRAHWENENALH